MKSKRRRTHIDQCNSSSAFKPAESALAGVADFLIGGTWIAAEKPDPELRRRMLNTRWSILDLVADMLPAPGVPLALEDEAEQPPPSVH